MDNAAQAVADSHWFWDRSATGGILIEHGVHFFDVFRQIAGDAVPRHTTDGGRRIRATVEYQSGAWGDFYHDFSLDLRVEQLRATLISEKATAEITGWIPQRLELRALIEDRDADWAQVASKHSQAQFEFSGGVATVVKSVPDRQKTYAAIISGIRQVVRAHRDPSQQPLVTPKDARASLRLAIDAQGLAGHT